MLPERHQPRAGNCCQPRGIMERYRHGEIPRSNHVQLYRQQHTRDGKVTFGHFSFCSHLKWRCQFVNNSETHSDEHTLKGKYVFKWAMERATGVSARAKPGHFYSEALTTIKGEQHMWNGEGKGEPSGNPGAVLRLYQRSGSIRGSALGEGRTSAFLGHGSWMSRATTPPRPTTHHMCRPPVECRERLGTDTILVY